jgi:hypothetical protein
VESSVNRECFLNDGKMRKKILNEIKENHKIMGSEIGNTIFVIIKQKI